MREVLNKHHAGVSPGAVRRRFLRILSLCPRQAIFDA